MWETHVWDFVGNTMMTNRTKKTLRNGSRNGKLFGDNNNDNSGGRHNLVVPIAVQNKNVNKYLLQHLQLQLQLLKNTTSASRRCNGNNNDVYQLGCYCQGYYHPCHVLLRKHNNITATKNQTKNLTFQDRGQIHIPPSNSKKKSTNYTTTTNNNNNFYYYYVVRLKKGY